MVSYKSNNLHQEYFSHIGKVISLLEAFPVPWGWPMESSSESGGSEAHTGLSSFTHHGPSLWRNSRKQGSYWVRSQLPLTLCHGKEAEIGTVCASVWLTFSIFTVQNTPGHKEAHPLWTDLLILTQSQYNCLYPCPEAHLSDSRSCQADRSTSHYKCPYPFGTLYATRMRPPPTKQQSSQGHGGICMIILCASLELCMTHYIYQLLDSDMIIC